MKADDNNVITSGAAMTIAQLLFHCSRLTPVNYFIPKGIKNRLYMNHIRSLTEQAIRESGASDIYSTRPIDCDPESPLKVWMVTSKKDLLMTFWCLKSLMRVSGEVWDVWIADGGGFDEHTVSLCRNHFPGIRILLADALVQRASPALRTFPLSYWLRHERNFPLSIKLFDPLFHLPPRRFLLLDSDILFFQKPLELLALLRNEITMVGHAFNLENGQINSGLAVIDPSAITLEEIERHLASMSDQQRRSWWIEQDLYIKLAGNAYFGLAPDYAVQPLTEKQHETCVSSHYISIMRHRFYEQGIPRLRSLGLLDSLANLEMMCR